MPSEKRKSKASKGRRRNQSLPPLNPELTYVLHTDGASVPNPGPSSIGVVLKDPRGEEVGRLSESIGWATNNEAEYKALIEGLKIASKNGVQHLLIRCDSILIVKQSLGEYSVKKQELKPLCKEAKSLLGCFPRWKLEHVLRGENAEADALADQALGLRADSDRLLIRHTAGFNSHCKKCSARTLKGGTVCLVQLRGKKSWVCSLCAEKIGL
ncbi:MAG: ribonuclease HI family protein [Actinomycetota bacterium]|nr:ribonuclease HI family protein [Actinomycetota bacterium]